MIFSLFYVILAILGLSFLIFIHELGHYYVARRTGMRVETFSIGFGKPIYKWKKDGVNWQIGWLLFGGFVKIAGMETNQKEDIYSIEEGFYSKSPLDRIKVAFAGPFVNIVFAFLAFTLLWSLGGREKSFSEYTHKIGWVDPNSELYAQGVRPGDEIISYNDEPFRSAKSHLYAPMTADKTLTVKGFKVLPQTGERTPFSYVVTPYPHPQAMDKEVLTSGILQPASYLIYDRLPNGAENPLPEGSPLANSGIEYGDRILWVDGQIIYSLQQLNHLLNDSKALLTVKQGNAVFLRRAPRVMAEELRLDPSFKEELVDWQYEADLNGVKLQKLYTLPYNLTNQGVVENQLQFIDKDKQEEFFPSHPYSTIDTPLQPGDRIIAVDGVPVKFSSDILEKIQKHQVHVVVERDIRASQIFPAKVADHLFDQRTEWDDLHELVSQIGDPLLENERNNLIMLKPVVPKSFEALMFSSEQGSPNAAKRVDQQRAIEAISDPARRAQIIHLVEAQNKQLLLGLPSVQDQHVQYNPNPIELFDDVVGEITTTLQALFTGSLNPKWMSGPLGIVQVVQHQSMVSSKEALYWMGLISLNLGILNLLPIPVLDGGTICFSLYEMITRHRIKPKTMEKLIIPFALLLIGFFIFVTYHDIMRILSGFFR